MSDMQKRKKTVSKGKKSTTFADKAGDRIAKYLARVGVASRLWESHAGATRHAQERRRD